MRQFLLPILFFTSFLCKGQVNLVPNPSFEDTVNCTTGFIYEANGWLSFTDSPDYFHSCADVPSGFNVPNTGFGYQQAFDGTAFGGLLNYGVSATPQREYMGIQLSSPLVIGQKYYVSFMASLADGAGANGWSNKLGAKFTTFAYSASDGDTLLMSNSAHVYSDSLLNDTINWVQIKGSFIADSSYQYIAIGNFFDDANTDTLNCTSASYIFIDMVCVSTDSLTCYIPTSIESQIQLPAIAIYPNPFVDHIQIDFPSLTQTYDVIVYNSLGQGIITKRMMNSPQALIDLSNTVDGILLVKILYDKQSFSFKLLKQ